MVAFIGERMSDAGDGIPSSLMTNTKKPPIDFTKVRRVKVDEPGDPAMQRQLAERLARQRMEESDDGTD